MDDKSLADLFESVTGNGMFRHCLSADHPSRDSARAEAISVLVGLGHIASDGLAAQPAIPPPLGGSFDGNLFKQIRDCPSRFKSDCGCAWPFRCWSAYGVSVSHDDCVKCLKSRNLTEPT